MKIKALFPLTDSVLEEYKSINHIANFTIAPIDILTKGKVTGLLSVVSKIKNVQIAIECVSSKNALFKGLMFRYSALGSSPERAFIAYTSEQNRCWARFVICKELVHVLLDTNQSYTKDPIALINNLINNVPPGVHEDVDSERLAHFGAIELLIPNECSPSMDATLEDTDSRAILAAKFCVPETIVYYRTSPAYPRRND